MRLTTKELVAEAHKAARSLPPESAKLVTELATRLDVTRAALCESLSERDRLAVENAAVKSAAKKVIKLNREHAKERHGNADVAESWKCVKLLRKAKAETLATDAFLAEMRSRGLDEMAIAYRKFASEEGCSCNMQSSYNLTAERAESYAAYVRRQEAF